MGSEIVEQVLALIRSLGLQAQRGFPPGRFPELEAPLAVVSLGRLVPHKGITEVKIRLLVPAKSGGAACEDLAMELTEALEGEGAWCTQDACDPFEGQKILCVPILASFQEEKPEVQLTLAAFIGDRELPGVVGITAWQATDETVTSLSSAVWHFKLEQLLTAGTQQVAVTEPFTLRITSAAGTEVLQNCTLESQNREATTQGLRWIRSGVARSRA